MDKTSFIKNFPQGKVIPNTLWKLFEYQENNKSGYSGYFQLYDRFGELPFSDILFPYFAFFGLDANGSRYGFWLYTDFILSDAPVIFFDFEGVRCTLIANSFVDFLSLLSLGVEELGYAIQEDSDWSNPQIFNENTLKFRHWLNTELQILPPEDPHGIISNARKAHPDLTLWLEAKTGVHIKPSITKWTPDQFKKRSG